MLIIYGPLFILGILLILSPKIIKHLAHAYNKQKSQKNLYQQQLLESVQNIETVVTPEPEDRVRDTVAAIRTLKQQQETRDAVEKLIDDLGE